MQNWYEYKNEIPLNTVRTWSSELLENSAWTFTGWSGLSKEPFRHWAAYGDLKAPIIKAIWECIEYSFKEEGLNLVPERILLNLFNHGDSSWIHKDSESPSDWTALIFLNDYWDINWGGETVIVENNEVVKAFTPTPGKYILFKSNLLHGARPVSREASYPRFGIAFQCKDVNKKL